MVENYSKSEKQAMEALAIMADVADSYEEDSVKDYSQEGLNIYKDSVNLGEGEKLLDLGDGYMNWNETPGKKKMEGARSLRKEDLEYYGQQLLGRYEYKTKFDSTGTGEIVYDSEKGFTLIDSKKNEFPVKSDRTFNFGYFFPEFDPGLMGGVTERVKNPKMDKWKKVGAVVGAGLVLAAPVVGAVGIAGADAISAHNNSDEYNNQDDDLKQDYPTFFRKQDYPTFLREPSKIQDHVYVKCLNPHSDFEINKLTLSDYKSFYENGDIEYLPNKLQIEEIKINEARWPFILTSNYKQITNPEVLGFSSFVKNVVIIPGYKEDIYSEKDSNKTVNVREVKTTKHTPTEIIYGGTIYENDYKNGLTEIYDALEDGDGKEFVNPGDKLMEDLNFETIKSALKRAGSLPYVSDSEQYGVGECFPSAAQVHKTGKDDCDGHAIYFNALANYYTKDNPFRITCQTFTFLDSNANTTYGHMWNPIYDKDGNLLGFADPTNKGMSENGDMYSPDIVKQISEYTPWYEFGNNSLKIHPQSKTTAENYGNTEGIIRFKEARNELGKMPHFEDFEELPPEEFARLIAESIKGMNESFVKQLPD
ncbi:MAG: hypothetical protein KAU95_02610 [Candidatus Aenigmarchaeota archaeon]|nr:hypothetical protein [Candidatus Aenigmarchaeota archaeon]